MAIRFQHKQLSNGLTLIAECNDQAHTAAVGFFVRTGARDEQRPVMGVSHFLEHMMFKGTARRSADDVNREFDEIGANYNAYTSQENTVYFARVLPEFMPRAVDLFVDMLRPALREADFEVEKKVILEEIGMYDDRPQWCLQDALMDAYFGDHPLGYRVLGTAESVAALQVEQMRHYFDQRYGPDNITVAAAGRVDFAQLVEDVEELAGAWQQSGAAARQYDLPPLDQQTCSIVDPKLTRHYVAAICPAPSAQDPRRYAAGILADVLGDSDGSRIYWALVDPGISDEADLSHQPGDQVGSYLAYASCDPQRAAQVERILLETIDTYVDQIDAGEIERTKNKLATGATLQGENPAGRMRGLGGQWTYLGEYTPLAEELDRIMAVTVADIRELLEAMPFEPRTIMRLGPNAVEPD
jgi:predicted Zn-dependent peptidase